MKNKNKPDNNGRKLQEIILQTSNESYKIYGDPKISEKLKAQGYKKASLKRIQRHMKKAKVC